MSDWIEKAAAACFRQAILDGSEPERFAELIRQHAAQHAALLAECWDLIDKFRIRHDPHCETQWDWYSTGYDAKCTCGLDKTLAALKSRIAALTGGG